MIVKTRASSLILYVALTGMLSSCTSRLSENTNTKTADQLVSATPPFRTREPDKYQAVRTTTFIDSTGRPTTTKTTIARDGASRREETGDVVVLDSDKGRFLLLPMANIYSEAQSPTPASDSGASTTVGEGDADMSAERFLHQEATTTKYEKLGQEVISGRNATKYRVTVNISFTEDVSSTETLMWIDDELKMPIKSETKTKDGSQSLTELSNISFAVDETLFKIPAGYEKVPLEEFRRRSKKD